MRHADRAVLSAIVSWQLLHWLTVDTYVPAVNQLSPSLINGVIAVELNELADWVSWPPAPASRRMGATRPPEPFATHRCACRS